MTKRNLIFGTGNSHKVQEVRALIPSEYSISSLSDVGFTDEIIEDGDSFEANAYIKAKAIWSKYGESCFAEDSGLVVLALDGDPGIYSSRYAGQDATSAENILKLLDNLKQVANRRAYFVSVFCLINRQGVHHFFRGECHGSISGEIRGESGFGYDPLFIPEGFELSFGEMSAEIKNTMSHRSKSLLLLSEYLKNNLI